MISGRDALASIENVIKTARKSETDLEASLQSAEEQATRLRADRSGAFRDLARVKLDSMMQDGVVQQLDYAERQALDMVKDRAIQLKEQARIRSQLFGAVQSAESDRHAKAERLEQALAALEAVKRAAEPKIRASAAWKAQQARIAAATKVAEEAEKKTTTSETDREIKRKPYEGDPLFMYLWNTKFGQAEYDAGPLTRFFDRMIARKVGYPDARANYAMLNEIPQRLREHAERCKLAIETERQGLAKAEAEALTEVGAGELVTKAETARQALIVVEKVLSSRKQELQDFEEKSRVALNDPVYEKAISILAEADSREDLRQLYAEALRTPSKDDERVVKQIETIDRKLERAEQEVEQTRAQARDIAAKRAAIERERDQFRRRGYDNPYGGFSNEGTLGQILGGILQGTIQGSILRDALRDGYQQRNNPWGGGVVVGPWTVPNNSPTPPQSSGGSWVPPWLDGGGSSGGGWSDSGSSGGSSGGGDGFSTGGGV